MQIAELLANFRQIAATAKEQGDLFEELVCKMLCKSPEYSEIARVDLWKDWAYNQKVVDIGIDLVVETKQGEFRAVQCKFYDSSSTIPKEEIDSFLSAAGRDYSGRKFSRLLLYTTAP